MIYSQHLLIYIGTYSIYIRIRSYSCTKCHVIMPRDLQTLRNITQYRTFRRRLFL